MDELNTDDMGGLRRDPNSIWVMHFAVQTFRYLGGLQS